MMRHRAVYELAVARTLRDLHAERDISRRSLAEALGVAEMEVTRLELGAEALSAGGLFVLLELYGLSWDDFRTRVTSHLDGAKAEVDQTYGHER